MRGGFRAARGCCTLRSLTRGTAWVSSAVYTGHHWPSPLLDRQTVTDISWILALRSTQYPQHAQTKHLFWVCCKMRMQEWCPLSSSPPISPGLARVSPITKHSSPSHPQFPQFEVNIRMKINNQFYSYLLNTRQMKITFNSEITWQSQKRLPAESEPWFGDIGTTLAPIGRRSLGFIFIGQFWVAGI